MAQQEDGWPLGLQPVTLRVGLVRNRNLSGSASFSTLLTASPTNTDCSSDLDSEHHSREPHGYFQHSKPLKKINEGTNGRNPQRQKELQVQNMVIFSMLEAKHRRRMHERCTIPRPFPGGREESCLSGYRRNRSPKILGPDDFSNSLPVSETNPLFIDDQVIPQSGRQSNNRASLEHDDDDDDDDGYGVLFPCLRGQLLK